ncbi:MAG: cobalamin biosynthesis protein CbiX [Bacteroidia bacterium]|nr:cobalamin biosynthesis protein CbiX [Bacteroidia bacterium]
MKIFSKFSGFFAILAMMVLTLVNSSCQNNASANQQAESGQKIGVLLVNHGSRSATWRQALLDLETSVKDKIMADGTVKGTKTAFMEYNEPSIATRLKEFDAEGYTDVILVPIFLTVSPHTFDDIPTIIGQKEDPHSMEALKIEKIERYTPKARTFLAPNLDFTDIIKKNVLARVQKLTKDAPNEGLVLIGYGDESYDKEWGALFDQVAEYVKQEVGITAHSYGWCGHIAHYDPQKTTDAIQKVLDTKKQAVVVPVLVAHDEMFQVKIIGDGINKIKDNQNRVYYKPDAILPDKNVEQWVVDITTEFVQKVQTAQKNS